MKELMEQQQFAPMRIIRPDHFLAEAGTLSLAVGQKQLEQPTAQLVGRLFQIDLTTRTGGKVDLKTIAVEEMVAFQGFQQQIVERKPDRSAPVRVAAEHSGFRIAGRIADRGIMPLAVKNVGVILVILRHRTDAAGSQEFVFVEQVFERPAQPARRGKCQQPVLVTVALADLHVGDRLPQIAAVGEKPLHALGEGGDPGQDRVVDHLDGQQRHKADERSQPHRNCHAVGAEMVVIEAILLVPQTGPTQRIEGVGNVDEMFEELGSDVLVGRVLAWPAPAPWPAWWCSTCPSRRCRRLVPGTPPCGSGRERSKTPILSRPRNPPAKICLPRMSLRLTHQLKLSRCL